MLKTRGQANTLIERIRAALTELETPFEEFERGGYPATRELFRALLAAAVYFALVDGVVTADETATLRRVFVDSFEDGFSAAAISAAVDQWLSRAQAALQRPRLLNELEAFDDEFGTSHAELVKELLLRTAVVTSQSDASVPGAEHEALKSYKKLLYGDAEIKIT